MSRFARPVGMLVLLICSSTVAFAHTGVDDASGFSHGFAHPLLGLDHALAMIMLGLYVYQRQGTATLLLPAIFVLSMVGGGMLGFLGVTVSFTEEVLALSVVAIGTVVAFASRPPIWLVSGLVATFAVLHGYANGAEAPGYVDGGTYALGFVLATAVLHATGMAFGAAMERVLHGRSIAQACGSVAACAGAAMFAGLL
ncbi:HupE/UreJ family protein [Rhizobium cauense]|uniref:HupE/UreJ family protein n=1 Tax=Rhizobium cauense TaxID=1166683 RepID=UPI001C6E35E8|nr:HupE/UreJ family protein [Rhizobium cauense]MBW9116431.1 HupE/UreJ family protein [Rhizobium cauense]